ncbi:MAG: phosphatidate cytidylyltransferase, partial [Pseudomonadota bacterium]
MLKLRILTALVLAPLVVAAIYLAPFAGYAATFAVITAAAAWEWAALIGCRTIPARALYTLAYLALAGGLYLVPALWLPLMCGAAVFWIYALIRVVGFDPERTLSGVQISDAFYGLLAIGGAFAALMALRSLPDGAHWVMLALLSVWLADVGAYFAGRRFGRRKLLAKVSPGKSWEGVFGGLAAVLLVVLVVLALWGQPRLGWWVPVLPLLVLFS